ncbi:MAG: hypothetical protein ABS44_05540 [Chryseobacterium sp. SCN 40-13]|nr:MAG: hypothetical protein ABS44_05540 [Chryseobacterium sp. SCN 40-13]
MFEFAITAWNLGNMMVLMPLKDSEEAIKTVHDMSINRELMKKLIDYKASHFKEYTNFIVDFEFKETNADPVLTVVTQEQETFLDMMRI